MMRFRGIRNLLFRNFWQSPVAGRQGSGARNCSNLIPEDSHSKANEVDNTILLPHCSGETISKSFMDFNSKIMARKYSPVDNIPIEILTPSFPEVGECTTEEEVREELMEDEDEELEPEKKFYYNCIVLRIRSVEIIERIRTIQMQLEEHNHLLKFPQISLDSLHITLLWLTTEISEFSDHCRRTETCMEEVAQTLRVINFRPVDITVEGVYYLGTRKKDQLLAAQIRRDENWQRLEGYLTLLSNTLVERNVLRFRDNREVYWNKVIEPHITFQRMIIAKKYTNGKSLKPPIQIPQKLFDSFSNFYFGVEAVRSFDLFLSKKIDFKSPLIRHPRFSCDFVSS